MGPLGIMSIVPKMATRGIVTILAMVVPPTVSLSVPRALPGVSSSFSSNLEPKFLLDQKVIAILLKMFSIARIEIETNTPGIRF